MVMLWLFLEKNPLIPANEFKFIPLLTLLGAIFAGGTGVGSFSAPRFLRLDGGGAFFDTGFSGGLEFNGSG